ncbi:MAG: CHC2 zinc finger domain-containing protein [Thermodesulfobacteriota bacterium]|nr:CHC2 zinc finger domain-containing protein [Thermodesulfobacteriota bacterium]
MVMAQSIEAIKKLNLVDFLRNHYHLDFQPIGGAYACHSPFTQDKTPSFFVRLVDGHWLFKDFSSGYGGSIFDFVRKKRTLRSSLTPYPIYVGFFHHFAPVLRPSVMHYPGRRMPVFQKRGHMILIGFIRSSGERISPYAGTIL